MASGRYAAGGNAFGKGDIRWKAAAGSTIKAVLIDSGTYTVNLATHANLSDIPAGARSSNFGATDQTLTLIDAANDGELDANDISFTGMSGAPSFEAMVLYDSTGVEATSTLLYYLDSATSGLPTSAGAATVNIVFNNGANKIAKI
jgi:hypothetical protein